MISDVVTKRGVSGSASNTVEAARRTADQLVNVYLFDPELSSRAIEAIADKSDVAAALDWALDHGGEDRGGPVTPVECPHLLDAVGSLEERGLDRGVFASRCSVCPSRGGWMCLECGGVFCSRYDQGHCKRHYEETRASAVGLGDLSFWCYACNSYVKHPALSGIHELLSMIKFDRTEPSDDEPGGTLKNMADLAEFIESEGCRSIVCLTGAGTSVSSGIPDYRSTGGFYDTIRPELLTASESEREAIRKDPSVAVQKKMFLQNQLPFLEVKREFILGTHAGRWKPTVAHRFLEALHVRTGKLTRVYTQNIDGLDARCKNLPADLVVPVHGSMGEAACMACGHPADTDQFCHDVKRHIRDVTLADVDAPRRSTTIACGVCAQETVKPTVVLFGEALPEKFFECTDTDLPGVDLLVVLGTSLTVAPANEIVQTIPESALRVVINRQPVGQSLGIRYGSEAGRDFFAKGSCDEICLDLMEHLGWTDDLVDVLDDLPESCAALVREHMGHTNKR